MCTPATQSALLLQEVYVKNTFSSRGWYPVLIHFLQTVRSPSSQSVADKQVRSALLRPTPGSPPAHDPAGANRPGRRAAPCRAILSAGLQARLPVAPDKR